LTISFGTVYRLNFKASVNQRRCKMSKSFFVVVFLLLCFMHLPQAVAEEITLSTYYPAPYGEYDFLSADTGVDIGSPRLTGSSLVGLNIHDSADGGIYTNMHFAQRAWSGSHAILFNALKRSTQVNGSLLTTGNTIYANNVGAYGGGAGGIFFNGNGGNMHLACSPASTGQGNNINWGTPQVTIQRNGSVGIGTTSLNSNMMFQVHGEIASRTVGPSGGHIRMIQGNYGAFFRNDGTNFYLLLTNSGNQYGSWNALRPMYVNLSTGYVTFGQGHGDLAENYYVKGKAPRASLVSIDGNNPRSAVPASQVSPYLIGVVSTVPGAVMDLDGEGFKIGPPTQLEYFNEKAPIAIAGMVPVIITTENGIPQIGDSIGVSNLPGFGAKMLTTGNTIGKALENLDITAYSEVSAIENIVWPEDDGKNTLKPCFRLPDGTYIGKIMISLAPSWFDPDSELANLDDFAIHVGDDDASLFNAAINAFVNRIGTFKKLMVAKMKAGLIYAENIMSKEIITENAILERVQIKDQATGERYFVGIRNGEWFTEKIET
jgi:hypothetical protein